MESVPEKSPKGPHFAIHASGDPIPEARSRVHETCLAQKVPHTLGNCLEGISGTTNLHELETILHLRSNTNLLLFIIP